MQQLGDKCRVKMNQDQHMAIKDCPDKAYMQMCIVCIPQHFLQQRSRTLLDGGQVKEKSRIPSLPLIKCAHTAMLAYYYCMISWLWVDHPVMWNCTQKGK